MLVECTKALCHTEINGLKPVSKQQLYLYFNLSTTWNINEVFIYEYKYKFWNLYSSVRK